MRRRCLLGSNIDEGASLEHYIEVKYEVNNETEFYVFGQDFNLNVIERMERYDFPGFFNEIDIENPTVSGTYGTYKKYRFYFKRGDISLAYIFEDIENIVEIDISQLDTSKMTDMSCMFQSFKYFSSGIDVSTFITKNVVNMDSMFDHSEGKVYGLDKFDTSKVKSMNRMFCWGDLDVDEILNWDLSSVEDTSYMFTANVSAEYILQYWNSFPNLLDCSNMFEGDTLSNTINIDGFYTPKLQNMSDMFYDSWLYDVSIKNWDTSSVTSMGGLFRNCDRLETAYLDIDMSNLSANGGKEMFLTCTSLTSLTMTGKPSTKTNVYTDMFKGVETDGTFYYNEKYDYSRIIEQLPSTWTSEPITV